MTERAEITHLAKERKVRLGRKGAYIDMLRSIDREGREDTLCLWEGGEAQGSRNLVEGSSYYDPDLPRCLLSKKADWSQPGPSPDCTLW